MKFILNSPLHGLMSSNTMLLTFTGRKSGKQFTTPISYARCGDEVTLITGRRHGWWRNLVEVAPVTARIQGHDVAGQAQVVQAEPATLIKEMQQVYKGIPEQKATELLDDSILIKITLS
jgi:deazaflavin-dependent oxidoreductase (nitroreductase family)